jgi:hypothetical protein
LRMSRYALPVSGLMKAWSLRMSVGNDCSASIVRGVR